MKQKNEIPGPKAKTILFQHKHNNKRMHIIFIVLLAGGADDDGGLNWNG